MIDRVRQRIASGRPYGTTRRVSRREREHFRRKILVIGVTVVSALLIIILATGAFYQYVYLPGQTLVTVGGVDIERGDYWKVRKLELINQISQYQQIAQFTSGQQATQYLQLAEQARAQLETVEGDPANPSTVNRMVDDQVLLQRLDSLGITIDDAAVDEYIAESFAPAPLSSPTPTLEVDPTAAAWATATAEATPSPSPTATASPTAVGTPAASPTANEAAESTPEPDATSTNTESRATPEATGTPAATPSPTPTMNPDDARATATAQFDQYQEDVLDRVGMNVEDYRRLVARPQVARQRAQHALQSEVPTRAEQVHAAHILVATEEAAKSIIEDALKEKEFAEVAKTQSTDSATAANGGDLGWFSRGVMVPEFEHVAFSLEPGEVSPPVQTKFGWHVIKVLERDEDRPLTAETLQTLRSQALPNWLDDQRTTIEITWHEGRLGPQPTPVPQFQPPPDAPTPPTPTPTPTATPAPSGTPEGGTTSPTATP